MPALAPICDNADAVKSPKRRTRSTALILESSPEKLSSKSEKTLRRSRRRRKSTVHGLENVYSYYSSSQQQQQQEQTQQTQQDKRWASPGKDSAPSAPDRSPGSPPAPMPAVVTQPSPEEGSHEVPIETQSDVTSTHCSADSNMVNDSQIEADIETHRDENELSLDTTMKPSEEETTENETAKSSPPLSSDASAEDSPEKAPKDTGTNLPAEGGDTKDTNRPKNSAAVSPAPSKSRLSWLMSLRPPPRTQSSILRRKCTPAENGAVYDGTSREESALNPTSDIHFDALAAFEASSIPKTSTANVKNAAGSDLLVIDLATLRERLNVLFPEQFSRPVGKTATVRKGRASSISKPPCILPRLIACYTIYRDYQRTQLAEQQKDDAETESPNKRRRTMNGVEKIDATGSAVTSEAVESISIIQNLLQKLVDLEWTVLEGHEHRDEEEGKSTTFVPPSSEAKSSFASFWKTAKKEKHDGNRKRRVQFAAFDDTAVVRSPSDVLEGSYRPQDKCVKALMSVLNAVEETFPKAISSSPIPLSPDTAEKSDSCDAAAIVRDFIFYLDNEFIPQCHDTICVESLMAIENQNIPIGRVEKAAIAYSRELDSLINPKGKMMKQRFAVARTDEKEISDDNVVVPLSIQNVDVFVRSNPLTWESRLANTSSQLVRYWLRTLMNPIPERSDCDTKTNKWNMRLFDYVNLTEQPDEEEFNINVNVSNNIYDESDADQCISTDEDDSSGETYDDDKLSSMLSNALAHVYGYLKLGSASGASWKDCLQREIPDETCCATSVCVDGFGTARKPAYIDDEDWQELREHLMKASDFCAFHRRALFIERLLSVVERLGWIDRWTHTVQAAAEKLVKMQGSNKNYAISLDNVDSNKDNLDGYVVSGSLSESTRIFDRVVQPEDEHLVLLGIPPRELLDLLRTEILPLSCDRYEVCRANLRRTEKNFRLGFSSTKKKKKFEPHIGELEAYWKDWLHPDTIFPSLSFRGYQPE